nr:uncharacterized protein LOC124810537 [Hydra vulgaris]
MWLNSKRVLGFSVFINNDLYKKYFSDFKLGCNHYSISQVLDQYYNFTMKISGIIVLTMENTDAKEFKNVKLYLSDPWHTAQPGYTKNLLVSKGCSELFTLVEKSDITHNNLLQTLAIFPIEYEIAFEACLSSFTSGNYWSASSNVFYFTNSGYDFCVACMWFSPNGEMELAALINGTTYSFTTKPFKTGCKQYKIRQILYQGNYMFTVQVDGWTLSTVKNIAPQVFKNVQIYISDPWTVAQPGYTNNFIITNRCSDLFSLKEEFFIVQNSLFQTIAIFFLKSMK